MTSAPTYGLVNGKLLDPVAVPLDLASPNSLLLTRSAGARDSSLGARDTSASVLNLDPYLGKVAPCVVNLSFGSSEKF